MNPEPSRSGEYVVETIALEKAIAEAYKEGKIGKNASGSGIRSLHLLYYSQA